MARVYTVVLKIVRERGGGDTIYAGCGAWGTAADLKDARRIARRKLVEGFGPKYLAAEHVFVEEVDEGEGEEVREALELTRRTKARVEKLKSELDQAIEDHSSATTALLEASARAEEGRG